jgi:hypothetical protein
LTFTSALLRTGKVAAAFSANADFLPRLET